nr:protein let-653-like [Lepeophtheirus salmonis]
MHHYYITSLLLLSTFTPPSLAGISYINSRSSNPNKKLLNCLPIKECKVLYGTKPSHFSIYGFISYHQFNCLPEEGNALCVVSANSDGVQILPCLIREKCAEMYGVKNTHFVAYGHQPVCDVKSLVRCVLSKEEELGDSADPFPSPTMTTCYTTKNPTTKPIIHITTTTKSTNNYPPVVATTTNNYPPVVATTTNNYPPFIVTTTYATYPTIQSTTHAPIYMVNKPSSYPTFMPSTSRPDITTGMPYPQSPYPTIKPLLLETTNLPHNIISFPFPTGGHGQINVHAPNAHHWSINPSTKVEIHGQIPTYLTWGQAVSNSYPAKNTFQKILKGRSRQNNLYNFLTTGVD